MHQEIDLGTIAGLHAHEHTLAAYCRICERWAVIDLAALIAKGKGGLRVPWRARCSYCGEPGQLQVRPPMPTHSTSRGWI